MQTAGLGLTTALGVLKGGFIIVGNVPASYDSNGNLISVGQGSLLILDRFGRQVASLSDPKLLNGPWGLTINDRGNQAQLFVSNVLSGTVTRIDLKVPRHGDHVVVESMTQIASGYAHRSDPAALVVVPQGLAYDAKKDLLYVALTADNAIFAIPHAGRTSVDQGMGTLVYQDQAHLRGPLDLVLAPNGDLLTTNGDAVDTAQGAAFGLALNVTDKTITLATVNNDTNKLDLRFVSFS